MTFGSVCKYNKYQESSIDNWTEELLGRLEAFEEWCYEKSLKQHVWRACRFRRSLWERWKVEALEINSVKIVNVMGYMSKHESVTVEEMLKIKVRDTARDDLTKWSVDRGSKKHQRVENFITVFVCWNKKSFCQNRVSRQVKIQVRHEI